jgi:hypothetical protein
VDPALAFQVLNGVVLPWWALWLAAPRSRWAGRLASHAGVFVALAVAYTLLLAAALASGGEGGGFDFDGMRAAMGTPLGFLAGWTHFIVFDLFVGAWIVRESARLSLEPRPYLFFALMAGPIGLGSFLVRRALHLRSWGQLGEVDLA